MSDTTPIDIGHGMTAALRLAEGLRALEIEDGVPVGVLLTHRCPKLGGQETKDFIPVEPYQSPGAGPWTLDSRDPITLSPSVSYTCCGLHGFVRSGKWVPA